MSAPDLLLADEACDNAVLASQPFVSNRYHFGMLLGVADLETEQAYHRGKTWLHNAWLHGPGVVWGLRVALRVRENEIVVSRGLAIDGHGRELYVAEAMCVNVGRWLDERRSEGIELERDDAGRLVVRVELCHDSCLERPVPSISEPCEHSNFDTAYSRAVERGLPRLVVGHAAPERPRSPRLRQFFGQLPVTDELVAGALTAVSNEAADRRAALCLHWFRRLAAADALDLAPTDEASWMPLDGEGCVVLAHLALRVDAEGRLVDDADTPSTVDNLVRPTHLATRTTQELLCHAHGGIAAPPGDDTDTDTDGDTDTDTDTDGDTDTDTDTDTGGDGDTDTGGDGDTDTPDVDDGVGAAAPIARAPQAIAESASIDGATIELAFSAPLDDTTVTSDAFGVTVLRADGWAASEVTRVDLTDDGLTARVHLRGVPRRRPIRVLAAGGGATPLLGVDGRVLSGVVGEPITHGGADAAVMITGDTAPNEE